jgi:decaprenylphospho-beta-D-erythro-pentofuranosid-2-ulose 2-reductase
LLWSTPEVIANGIEQAIKKKKDEIYLPRWWAAVMMIIKLIPERIFKSLSL